MMRAKTILLSTFVTLAASAAATSWWIGGQLLAPSLRPVAKPPDLAISVVAIPSGAHSVAAWWVDRGPGTPVVLLVHGIRGNRNDMLPRARLFGSRGYSVLLIDLQAHGETPGDAITFGWREAADVRGAIRWIRSREPGRRIGAVGTSLGGAALVFAHPFPPLDAVVLEEVYPRLAKAVENRVRIRLGWLAPLVTPLLLAQLEPRIGVGPAQLEPVRFVSALESPVLVAGGEMDARTSGEETRELFQAAKPPKELWIEPAAAHQDLLAFDAAGYEAHVIGFIDRYLRGSGVRPP
jgi:uncharacterized protein